MIGHDLFDTLYVLFAIVLQGMLALYFALRKWRFDTAMRVGWIIYALGVLAAILSVALLIVGKPWYFWIAGFLYAAWAAFGYVVDIARPVEWRSPIRWPVLIPYVVLYYGQPDVLLVAGGSHRTCVLVCLRRAVCGRRCAEPHLAWQAAG